MPQGKPKTELTLDEFEEQARAKYNIPKPLWESIKGQESGGDVNAVSPTGVRGRFQVTKKTAAAYGLDRDDPFHQAAAAAKNLREGYDKYGSLKDDNQRWLAAAGYYYGGPDAVKADGTLGTESKDNLSNPSAYVTGIAKRWKQYNDAQPQQVKPKKAQPKTAPADSPHRDPYGRPITAERAAQVKSTEEALLGAPDPKGYDTRGRSLSKLHAEFEAKPFLERAKLRTLDAFARGGGNISRMARQTAGVTGGLVQGLQTGDFTPVDFPAWRQMEDERTAELNRRALARPSTLATEIGEGIVEAVPTIGAAVALGTATGGGALPMMGIGGGLTAAGIPAEEWKAQPGRSALQTGLGAVAPAAGSKVGAAVARPIAQRLASPAAQGLVRGTGEIVGGGAANVAQSAIMGERSPRELAKAGAIGAGLSVPGATRIARGAAPPDALPPRTLSGVDPAIIENAARMPVSRQPGFVRPLDASTPRPIPLRQLGPEGLRTVRTPEGAIPGQPSSLPSRRLLPPAQTGALPTGPMPDVPPTGPLPIPDAPITQEMPAVRRARITAEDAPTAGLPAPIRQTQEMRIQGPPAPVRQTAEMPRTMPAAEPQQPVAPRLQQPAIQPTRRPTERLRVPTATDENIEQLRDRQEALNRVAFDRRGDFTGDLRDEFTEVNAKIRDFETARAPRELGPPPGRPESMIPPPGERQARRAALQPRTGPLPETLTPGRKVTQEMQVPGLRAAETHVSREDARQGHFERFDDAELVAEIQRLEGIRNDAIRGRSKLTPDELEAARFDLKVATTMQKERGRIQRQMGREAVERIEPRTPGRTFKEAEAAQEGRTIQHSKFGEVSESPDQSGVRKGQLRVTDAEGKAHIIRNPRIAGNREAAFVKKDEPGGHIMGGIFGGLQPLFQRTPSRKEISETAGGIQTAAQLGNPRFLIRNILQHAAFGKQERTATRLAASLDWAFSTVTGKPRQIAGPKGSDLAAYVRNWRTAVRAYKSGQPLPGGTSPVQHGANANAIDAGVRKLMTWINEIPDSANWQTRFEDSLQSIVRKNPRANTQDAIDQATMEANRAALRDPNFVSRAALLIRDGLNTASSPIFGTDKFGVGDFVLKYAQTPGALLKRGLERSPLGLFQVAKEAATPGPFRRRNTLLALSRVAEGAATGTGLGAALAAAGILVGPEEEGRAGKLMEREEGVKGYSLNASALRRFLTGESAEMQAGDTLYSIDWLQPWAMNLSVGAALWGLHKQGKLSVEEGAKSGGEAIYNSLAKTLDVMGDQSVMKNLSRFIDKARAGETFGDKFLIAAREIGLDIPSSFVPSTARQVRQVIDPFERDTRPEDRGGVRGFAKEAAGRALGQLPGMSEKFPKRPSLLTGEDRKTSLGEMGTGARIGAQFSPANISTFAPQPVAREISRLNRAGQKVAVSFPAPKTDRKTGAKEPTSSLRVREREFAERFSRLSREMIEHPRYENLDDEVKAAAFAGLERHIADLAEGKARELRPAQIIGAAMRNVRLRERRERD